MSEKRLESIDIWKGVTILSVLVIHTVFWSGRLYLPDWIRQISLLLDVPVFFFISGYLLQSSSAKTVVQRTGRQAIRLVADYGVVTLIVLVLAVALYFTLQLESRVELDLKTAIISALKFEPSGSVWEVLQVYGGSMWYLRVYLSVLLVGFLILASPLQRALLILPLFSYAAFLLTTYYSQLVLSFVLTDTRHLTFYLTLFLAGAVFKKYKNKFSLSGLIITWIILIFASLVIVFQNGGLPNLQEAKFPPSSLYLLFSLHSIMALCVLVLYESRSAFAKPRYRLRGFISWCGRHSFRIYLWQGVAASIPFFFIPTMLKRGIPTGVIFVVVLAWIFCVSLALTYGHNRLVSANTIPRKLEEGKNGDEGMH
jgi:peptidoglycan/LPS O-acetylase OafA/YrhL